MLEASAVCAMRDVVAAAGLTLRLAAKVPIPLDLSLSIAPGELLALVGPSGAGKSTALRCIAGLHRAEQGRIDCAGATWFDAAAGENLPPHRRAVGLVFQDYALFPHMTAASNVLAAMGHVPKAARPDRARDLFAMVHLSGLEDRRPAELSGGQQQRVAVARALARDPAILLLDEPFSAVDRATRRRLQAELAALRRSLAVPILLVTHDLEEALTLADRMVVMHRGRGLQTGTPAELLTRPASAEVARLLDLHNLFQGRVERHATDATFLRWGQRLLEAAPAPDHPPGAPVDWLVSGAGVVLHRRGRPSAGERENPVAARVLDLLSMGQEARITLDVGDPAGGTLGFSMPMHAALRNGLAAGEDCTVSLLREAIHLMPAGDTR
jgi:molybdate transport system ATP-binding protein